MLLPAGVAGAEDHKVGSADIVVWRDAAGTFHAETREEIESSDIHHPEVDRAFYRVVIRPDL